MKNKPFTHADHIHQHEQEQDDKEFKLTKGIVDVRETPAQGGLSRMMNGDDNKFAVPQYDPETLREQRMGKFDPKPMSLSPTSDEAITNFKQSALDHYLQQERDRACGIPPRLHDEPRPGHHYPTYQSRDDVRKNRAAMLSREYNDQNSERDSLRHRCHAIINSMEHMEIDKEIALLALEHIVSKGKL